MFLLLFFVLMMFIKDVSGVLTSTPSDVAIVNGTTFTLRCSTDTTQDLWWYRLGPGAQTEDHIVDGSEVNDKFRGFYSVLHENRKSTLTIVAAQFTAARYACVEIFTTKRATAQVIVLESEPSCSRNVTGDILNLTCMVTFRGQGNPIIIWTRLAGKEEKEVTDGIENTQRMGPFVTYTSTLIVQKDENERNHSQIYSYLYTVKFCLPDNATRTSDGRLCVFSQLLVIGEEVAETTYGIDKEATGTTSGIEAYITTKSEKTSSSIGALAITLTTTVPILVIISILVVGIYCHRKKRLNKAIKRPHSKDGILLQEKVSPTDHFSSA